MTANIMMPLTPSLLSKISGDSQQTQFHRFRYCSILPAWIAWRFEDRYWIGEMIQS